MKKNLFTLLFLTLTQISFSQNGVTIYDSIISSGLQRKYSLYLPPNFNASNSVPLVINLHGYTSNATQQAQYSNFMPIADTAGFLLVHPEGTKVNGNQFWNAGYASSVNDVQFISDLIDSLKLLYNINLDRVYSCGMSNGGIMSYYLALKLSSRITAVASVTGSMLNSWFSLTPIPARPFPVMEIHGTFDGTVPYNGDATFAHIDSVIKKWWQYNNCSPVTYSYNVPNISTSDNSSAIHYTYSSGTNGSTVELFKVVNGSHSWPGAAAVIPNTNQDFKASVEIWRFFSQYKTSQFFNVQSLNENTAETLTVFPNPAKNHLSVQCESRVKLIRLYDSFGRKIIEQNERELNIETIEPGVYIVEVETGQSKLYRKILKQ